MPPVHRRTGYLGSVAHKPAACFVSFIWNQPDYYCSDVTTYTLRCFRNTQRKCGDTVSRDGRGLKITPNSCEPRMETCVPAAGKPSWGQRCLRFLPCSLPAEALCYAAGPAPRACTPTGPPAVTRHPHTGLPTPAGPIRSSVPGIWSLRLGDRLACRGGHRRRELLWVLDSFGRGDCAHLRFCSEEPRHVHRCLLTAALSTTAEKRTQPQFPSADEWMRETWSSRAMEYHSVTKRSHPLLCATPWLTNPQGCGLSARSQPPKTTRARDSTHVDYMPGDSHSPGHPEQENPHRQKTGW